jgi:cobalt-zinc-cadmium efflux system protein
MSGQGHEHHAPSQPATALSIALALTAGFMLVEAAVGWLGGSLALLADAGHMLADAGSLALALAAQRWAARPRTQRSTYGFRRAEVLAAFVNGVLLALTAVLIVKEAAVRWMRPVMIHAEGVVVTASLGLVVNIVVALLLMRSRKHSLNVRAAFVHVIMDALGSVAAIVAGLAVLVFGAVRADPALSIFIALLVAHSGWRVLKEATAILLEGAPPHLDVVAIEKAVREVPGVAGVHDLHVWRISDRFDALTVHVTLARGAHGTDVCRAVNERLHADFGLEHVTVQPEAPLPDELVALRTSRDGAPIERAG